MPPSGSQHRVAPGPQASELPYGPLPVRPEAPGPADANGSGLAPLQAVSGSDLAPMDEHSSAGERLPEPASDRDVVNGREGDDDVHFGIAAKALGVSRRTIERMVKRGQLERGPSGAQATVSKRALVTALEQRRRDVGYLARATELAERHPGSEGLATRWPENVTMEVQELLRPVLEPLLDEFVAARTRAALLESQMASIQADAARERVRDELLLMLATGGWRQRRKARRTALRHYVLRDDVSSPSSADDP